MRVVTTQMGSFAALCLAPLAMRDARDFGVTRTLSQAWRIGRAIAICRQSKYVFILWMLDQSYMSCASDIAISMVL
jgi:DUF917 family protein